MRESVRDRLSIGTAVNTRNRNSEEPRLDLLFRVQRLEQGIEPLHDARKRSPGELVRAHLFALENLKRDLVSRYQAPERLLATDQQHPNEGRRSCSLVAARQP